MRIAGQLGRSIQPGQSEEVKITLSTGRGRREFEQAIQLETNDSEHRQTALKCKVKTLIAMNVEPVNVRFQRIARDAGPQTQTVLLTQADAGPIKPELLQPNQPSNIAAEIKEIEPGVKYELNVTLSPPWPNERVTGTITLKTGLEKATTERIPVFAQVEPRCALQPSAFNVPREREGETELRSAIVWSGAPGNVTEVTVNDPALAVRLDGEPGKQNVILTVPAGWGGQARVVPMIMVKTDDPIAPLVQASVRLTATARVGGFQRATVQSPQLHPSAAHSLEATSRPSASPSLKH